MGKMRGGRVKKFSKKYPTLDDKIDAILNLIKVCLLLASFASMFVVLASMSGCQESLDRQNQAEYLAWLHASGTTNLPYAEWQILSVCKELPNGRAK